MLLERGLRPADVAVQLGHTDGGRLVQILYGHPDEERALDRLLMAFSADGRKSEVEVTRLGQDPPQIANGTATNAGFFALVRPAVSTFAKNSDRPPNRGAALLGRGRRGS